MINDPILVDAYVLRHRLHVRDLKSPVAICALWKDLSKVDLESHPFSSAALIGNLYTTRGIGMMLRTLCQMTTIRHLVIWGPDTQHTGRALLTLWEDGLGEGNQIKGAEIAIDAGIPTHAIELLRTVIRIYDCRSIRDIGALDKFIGDLPYLEPYGEPQFYPESTPVPPPTLPSAKSGWQITSNKVATAWPRVVDLVMRFGEVKSSQYDINQREILNVLTVVTQEAVDDLHLPKYFDIRDEYLREYVPTILEDIPPDGLSYTYGNRLGGYFGRNQVNSMINALKKSANSRRAIASLWDVKSDPERDTPPCITQIVMNVAEGVLHLTYSTRSQDMFSAWPQNTLAMVHLLARAANELGLQTGTVTSHTVSAHIYDHDWTRAEELVANCQQLLQAVEFDPQGNFIIRVEGGQIHVELMDQSGENILWHANGTKSQDLGRLIASNRLASLPSHYVYLGRELQRAEEAIARGLPYDQGMA